MPSSPSSRGLRFRRPLSCGRHKTACLAMVLVTIAPKGGEKGLATLRMNTARIQKDLRDAFPNLNRLISRERFAEIATTAVVSSEKCQVDGEVLRVAAYSLFDEKLDAIGSGMVSVRQVISLIRFGYTEAAGAPVPMGQELFASASQPYRTMARVYDDSESLRSPRRRDGLLSGSGVRPRSRPSLDPLATSSGFSATEARRPQTQGGPVPLPLVAAVPRPQTQGGRAPQLASLADYAPPPGDSRMSSYDYSSSDDVEMEGFHQNLQSSQPQPSGYAAHFAPWGEVDAVAQERSARLQRPQRAQLRTSSSLPSMPSAGSIMDTPLPPEAALRYLQARLHQRLPRQMRELFDELDDGQGTAGAGALIEGLCDIGSEARPGLFLPEPSLRRLVEKFDHKGDGTIDLREFSRSLSSGRLPDKEARRRARSPPVTTSDADRPRRRKKKVASAADKGQQPPVDPEKHAVPDLSAAPPVPTDGSLIRSTPPSPNTPPSPLQGRKKGFKAAGIVAGMVNNKQRSISPDKELAVMAADNKSARAAALLLSMIREKCESTGGSVTRRQLNESLLDLGILSDLDDPPKELFDSIDLDGSGSIAINELEEAVAQLIDPDAVSQLEEMLKTGGSIGSQIGRLRDKLSSQAARVLDLFRKWDKNNDGQISRAEFARAMPHFGLQHCLPIEVSGLFNAFDPDGSGQISFRELHKMLRSEDKKSPPKMKVEKPKAPLVEPLDLRQLRRDAKHDVLKMNLQVEFQDLIALKGLTQKGNTAQNDEWEADEAGVIYRLTHPDPVAEASIWN